MLRISLICFHSGWSRVVDATTGAGSQTVLQTMDAILFHPPFQSGSLTSLSVSLNRIVSPIMFLFAIFILLTSSVVEAINTTTFVLPPVTSLTMAVTETVVVDCRIDINERLLNDVTLTWNAVRNPNGRWVIYIYIMIGLQKRSSILKRWFAGEDDGLRHNFVPC